MYSLAQPGFLALGAVLLLPSLLRYRRVWQYSNARLLRNTGQRDLLSIGLNAVTWMALGLLLIGLAKPLKGLEHVQEHLEARDVLLTLDLSLSMEGFLDWDGKDMPPTKLELIRDAALEFVRQHEHDRLGLIVFGDDAFGVWPPQLGPPNFGTALGAFGFVAAPGPAWYACGQGCRALS